MAPPLSRHIQSRSVPPTRDSMRPPRRDTHQVKHRKELVMTMVATPPVREERTASVEAADRPTLAPDADAAVAWLVE